MNSFYDNTSTSSDLHLSLPSPDGQEIFPFDPDFDPTTNYHPPLSIKYPQNPRKKRTKMLRIVDTHPISKPKYAKKPDPSAPKITRPCSECGKKFWSWKALFGHMRCHPERQWRGINPPPNLKKSDSGGVGSGTSSYVDDSGIRMTDEDYHVATCLLMLANGPISVRDQTPTVMAAAAITTAVTNVGISDPDTGFRDVGGFLGLGDYDVPGGSNCRFECSSCKKVFGSHQALGGHRASHKNVKGCFAFTRTEGEEDVAQEVVEGDHERNNIIGEASIMNPNSNNSTGSGTSTILVPYGSTHQCGICFRVFSSGQALGGHKRCHWEKLEDEHVNVGGSQGLNHGSFGLTACDLDLNMRPVNEASSSVSYTSNLALDLRLGL